MSIFINGIDRTPVNSLVLLNAAAGNEVANRIDYSVNKVAGDSTGLLVNLTPTSVPGTNYILALQTNGIDVFSVRRKGELAGTVTLNLAAGNETAWTLNYTTNKAAGNDTGLLINQTDTLSPGTSFLQDWQVGGVSKVCIRNDGNVGIGTTGPDQLLDVEKAQSAATRIQVNNPNAGTGAQSGLFVTNSDTANYYFTVGLLGTGFTTSGQFEQNTATISVGSQIDGINIFTQKVDAPLNLGTSVGKVMTIISGNVGIGTSAPNANALLDITSTTKAFMPPRMTTAQRDVIAVPTAGMVIYNSTTGVLDFYNGAVWGAV